MSQLKSDSVLQFLNGDRSPLAATTPGLSAKIHDTDGGVMAFPLVALAFWMGVSIAAKNA